MRRKWGTFRAASIIALLAIFGIVNGSHLSLTLIAASRPSAKSDATAIAGHGDVADAAHGDTSALTGDAAPASGHDEEIPLPTSGSQR